MSQVMAANRQDAMKFAQRITSTALLLLLLAVCASAHSSVGPQGVYLGNARVDGRFDHDTIRVGSGSGPFRAIQLRVDGGPVEFSRVVVRYQNGYREELPVPYRLLPGGRSRIMSLSGHRRAIRHVELWYGKPHWARHTTVSIYGYR